MDINFTALIPASTAFSFCPRPANAIPSALYNLESSGFLRIMDSIVSMCLQESVVGIYIEVNNDLLFESCFKFTLQIINKFSYPTVILIIFLSITYEDIVFEIREQCLSF